jgi:hypothetical protein
LCKCAPDRYSTSQGTGVCAGIVVERQRRAGQSHCRSRCLRVVFAAVTAASSKSGAGMGRNRMMSHNTCRRAGKDRQA